MKLASWNINSIRKRVDHIIRWLQKETPDWLFLQEIKCQTDQFPKELFEAVGYQTIVHGQKSYNGVAILSKHPFILNFTTLPFLSNKAEEARYIEIESENLTLCNLYLPNGNSGGEAGFQKKIDFCQALYQHAQQLLKDKKNILMAGDFNICPTKLDYHCKALSNEDALIHPLSINAYYKLQWLGFSDALRTKYPSDRLYTFWDYQQNCWQRNVGLRIDHIFLSPTLTQQLQTIIIDKEERNKDQPSDHVPIIVNF